MARKRANGEGSLRQLENGSWMCQLMVGHKPDGTRDIRTFVGKTQKEALHRRDEFKRKMAEGLLLAEDLRFEEWADTWYGNHQDNIKPTTQENYRYTLRILKDHFGRRRLSEIKAMDVEQFLKKLRKDGRSHSYIAQCRGMLFQIFNKAVANDILMKNPVAYADKMRKQPPKSNDSYRTIPVPEFVRYCARNLRDTDKKFIWEVGKPDMPCTPSYFRNQFKKALERIEGVRILTPHCCRHTYVSQMIAMGVDPKTVQSIVGHADIDMTFYYAHAQEPQRQEAVQRFSEAFSKNGRGVHGNILDLIKSS